MPNTLPNQVIDLNNFSNAIPEALYSLGRYIEDPGSRDDRGYYWAQIAYWYLGQAGIPARPSRAPNASEMRGMFRISDLRRNVRVWIKAQVAAGRSPSERAFIDDTNTRFRDGILNDAEIMAGIKYLKSELATDQFTVAVQTPSFNELWERAQGIENRPDAARCQSLEEAHNYAKILRGRLSTDPIPDAIDEFDVARVEDMLKFLDGFGINEPPFDPPATRDQQFGPAPDLSGI